MKRTKRFVKRVLVFTVNLVLTIVFLVLWGIFAEFLPWVCDCARERWHDLCDLWESSGEVVDE